MAPVALPKDHQILVMVLRHYASQKSVRWPSSTGHRYYYVGRRTALKVPALIRLPLVQGPESLMRQIVRNVGEAVQSSNVIEWYVRGEIRVYSVTAAGKRVVWGQTLNEVREVEVWVKSVVDRMASLGHLFQAQVFQSSP